MSIIRTSHNRENPYVMINKHGLTDPDLSWAAKGLWAYLLHLPDDWNVSVAHLCKIYKGKGGGEEAVWSMLNELIKHGYCERIDKRAVKGKFTGVEYIVKEFKEKVPHRSQPGPVQPDPVKTGYTKDEVFSPLNSPDFSKKTTTTTKTTEREVVEVVDNFSQEEKQARNMSSNLIKIAQEKGPKWNIPFHIIKQLMDRNGHLYVTEQYIYMLNQQENAEKDEYNTYKKNKTKPVDKPQSFLVNACNANWALSQNKKEKL